jgi:hypothetical protein
MPVANVVSSGNGEAILFQSQKLASEYAINNGIDEFKVVGIGR